MEKWCYVVSDYCREVCPIVVFEDGELANDKFLGRMKDLINAFLTKHDDSHLRFITRVEEKMKLLEEGYSFLDLFESEEAEDYIKKYVVISK